MVLCCTAGGRQRLHAAQALHRVGYAVLLPKSRNHGCSDRAGHSSQPRFAEGLDHALDFLAATSPAMGQDVEQPTRLHRHHPLHARACVFKSF